VNFVVPHGGVPNDTPFTGDQHSNTESIRNQYGTNQIQKEKARNK